ncbi:hypothetical protein PAPYR_10211 [Paratrimastix pyriformis]|uniref:C2 domain-containing protein n=1 Tax=Paratrimastix pyriformis TaxID=342808 RepID=A0ABQ8UBG2_9EUKA|nr:hypothetical protein PAPYR_10211 [Paratrimastix pyriformis]
MGCSSSHPKALNPAIKHAWTMSLTVHSATGIRASDSSGASDPYCIVTAGRAQKRTCVINKTQNPNWQQTFYFYFDEMDKVKLTVCDWDRTTDDDILGSAEIPLAPIARDGTLVTFPHLPLAGPRAQGEINVDVSIRAYRDGFDKDLSSLQTIGFLNLRLVRVEGLCRTLRQSRPFAKFHFGEQTWVCAPAMARDDGNTWTLEATEVDLVLNEQVRLLAGGGTGGWLLSGSRVCVCAYVSFDIGG